MAISKEIVEYTAKLARLELSEMEKELYFHQLNNILDFINVINSVNVNNISPTANTRISSSEKASTPLRKDEICPFEETQKILSLAPKSEENMFKVPKIIEDD